MVKRRLQRAGFQVCLPDPTLAAERKRAERLRDAELLSQGNASPGQVQRKNSFFDGRAKRFQISRLWITVASTMESDGRKAILLAYEPHCRHLYSSFKNPSAVRIFIPRNSRSGSRCFLSPDTM